MRVEWGYGSMGEGKESHELHFFTFLSSFVKCPHFTRVRDSLIQLFCTALVRALIKRGFRKYLFLYVQIHFLYFTIQAHIIPVIKKQYMSNPCFVFYPITIVGDVSIDTRTLRSSTSESPSNYTD